MNRPWKVWVGKCWDVSWHPAWEWWGATVLPGWGEMSSLQVSQGHVVRPYLQHRTATFLWYFASGKKWGIIEKSDLGKELVWSMKAALWQAVINHPDVLKDPHLNWDSCLLGAWSGWNLLVLQGLLRGWTFPSLLTNVPWLHISPNTSLLLRKAIKETTESASAVSFEF